jgi:hypothetical protein
MAEWYDQRVKKGKSMLSLLPGGPPPTVDAARERLGGRASTGPGAGEIVGVRTGLGFTSGDERDVWVGDGRIRRVDEARIVGAPQPVDAALEAVAADVRVFATMREGEPVRFLAHDGAMREGTLVEKCRYGALVLGSGGKIVAASFRRLWPVAAEA